MNKIMKQTALLLVATNVFAASVIAVAPVGAHAANQSVQGSIYGTVKAEINALFIGKDPENDIRAGLDRVPVNDAIEDVTLLEDPVQQAELRLILDKAISQLAAKIEASLTVDTALNGATEITGKLEAQSVFIAEVYNATGKKIAMTTGMATEDNTYKIALNRVNRYDEDGSWLDMGAITLEKGMKVKVYVNLLNAKGQRFVAADTTQDVIGIPYDEAEAAVLGLFVNNDPAKMIATTASKATVAEAQMKVAVLPASPAKDTLQGNLDRAKTLVGARDAFQGITLSEDHKAAIFAFDNAEQVEYIYRFTVNNNAITTTSTVSGNKKNAVSASNLEIGDTVAVWIQAQNKYYLLADLEVTAVPTPAELARYLVNGLFIEDNPTNHVKATTNQTELNKAQAQVNLVMDYVVRAGIQKDLDKAKSEFNIIAPITINPVTTNATMVTGTGEPNAGVVVRNGSLVLGSSIVGENGAYSVSIPQQTVGTTLTVYITKPLNGKANVASIYVAKGADITLSVNDYKLGEATITGTYGKNIPRVRLWVNGKAVTQATLNADGTFTIDMASNYVKALTDEIEIVAVDSKFVEITRVSGEITGSIIKDYGLTADGYQVDTANLEGTYGKDIAKVFLWVNGESVSEATTNPDGTYQAENIAQFVASKKDIVEVVGVDAQDKEVKRVKVKVTSSPLENWVKADTYKFGTQTLTGTIGKNISKVRLWVNGKAVQEATINEDYSYIFENAKRSILKETDLVEVVGVDDAYVEIDREQVSVEPIALDLELTADDYAFGSLMLTGTYGKDIKYVRLFVNGEVAKQADLDPVTGTYTCNDIIKKITSNADNLEIVAVDAKFKEIKRISVTMK
ncbi:hypothetical protein DUK53_13865 [Listeria sp. SHR_NRA_18]|uniref:immunoglobulin-like domain-containing protein n=1 Tax=Listeria sp. SHR_NRA_18 TaxID=2269046 RepID=UPI00051CC259|nr:immunoglobulin-like domain-containing protein [Listeria sp. SHR_NRA_18]KGL46712.1 hypothetical protein EP56_00840 [Listeriaceae bacterium FSL A5-0209]RQW65927.1 hypothetical protein DUK53_13865 [Listeria sp. SHR_NRA_18]